MPATSIGFWRVLLGTACLALWGLLWRRSLFRADARGWLLVGAGGGLLVALFEVTYQFAIAGAGVAGAAALLYTAPVIGAVLARVLLNEALTVTRVLLALLVMAGVALTVTGGSNAGAEAARLGIGAGIAGGLVSALSYAGTTLLARFAVPRYGAVRVLFLEALGGIVILGIVLPLAGHPPTPPPPAAAWRGGAGLTAGAAFSPNFPLFATGPPLPPALDTATPTITGSETIRYTNNSPDTLTYLWLQLDRNIYRASSRGAAINPTDARFAGRGFEGGYTIQYVRAVQRFGKASGRAPLATTVNGTVMRAELDRPLPPGQAATLELAYSFEVPEHGSDRMGREQFPGGWLYEIAQWYPRLAVYDDVRGWNTEQYLGQGEFYLEYGDFDVPLTVPRRLVVAAARTLLNPLEVLTGPQRARLAQALKSDTTIAVIAKTEVGQPFTRPAGAGPTLTWHYSAKNVRDVAWAAAPNFIWDASGYAGVLIQSLYPPEANAGWSRSTEYARHSIKHYSEKWFRYPYPTAINVAGPVGGMAYPMIGFCGHRAGDRGLFGVTPHELGHQWFPMVVGSN